MCGPEALELEVNSDPQCLPVLRARVRAWAESLRWPERQIGELVLALDEAVSNVICHAYEGRRQERILVTAETLVDPHCGEGIEIRVRDFGKQVDPQQICGRALDDVRPGGLGVHIIRAMTSAAQYQRAEGGGMLLTMRKFRSHTADCGGGAAVPE